MSFGGCKSVGEWTAGGKDGRGASSRPQVLERILRDGHKLLLFTVRAFATNRKSTQISHAVSILTARESVPDFDIHAKHSMAWPGLNAAWVDTPYQAARLTPPLLFVASSIPLALGPPFLAIRFYSYSPYMI